MGRFIAVRFPYAERLVYGALETNEVGQADQMQVVFLGAKHEVVESGGAAHMALEGLDGTASELLDTSGVASYGYTQPCPRKASTSTRQQARLHLSGRRYSRGIWVNYTTGQKMQQINVS